MKRAYPNFSDYMASSPIYDLNKWMSTMKDIYIKLHLGTTRNASVEQATESWDPNEKKEFLNWIKYYESGDHLKYKKAQNSYYVNDDINYFLPNPKAVPSPIKSINDQIANVSNDAAQQAAQRQIDVQRQSELQKEEKRKVVEDFRRKILGRLNSAEKLLSTQQGQMFAGADFEKLLSAIFELKKQIQIVNKIALSGETIVDLIIRQANILKHQGHKNASSFMVKLAQNTPGDFSMNLGEVPAGGSQPDGGGSLANNSPDLAQPSGDEITDGTAVGDFIENLEDFGITTEKDVEDDSFADDVIIDDDVLLDQEIVSESDNDLIVEAQDAQPTPAPQAKPVLPKENIEVDSPPANSIGMTPEEVRQEPKIELKNDFDALIDSAFANLTVEDVVRKLEDVNKIFRNREISRQLAIVEVMLGRLGLAPYFPTLAETSAKQLESNSYCLSRLEDMLSKLRGTMKTKELDLTHENQTLSPDKEQVKSILEQDEQKEKQRKEVKKQLQDQTNLEKATKPNATVENVQNELAQPAEIEQPVKPAVPVK